MCLLVLMSSAILYILFSCFSMLEMGRDTIARTPHIYVVWSGDTNFQSTCGLHSDNVFFQEFTVLVILTPVRFLVWNSQTIFNTKLNICQNWKEGLKVVQPVLIHRWNRVVTAHVLDLHNIYLLMYLLIYLFILVFLFTLSSVWTWTSETSLSLHSLDWGSILVSLEHSGRPAVKTACGRRCARPPSHTRRWIELLRSIHEVMFHSNKQTLETLFGEWRVTSL